MESNLTNDILSYPQLDKIYLSGVGFYDTEQTAERILERMRAVQDAVLSLPNGKEQQYIWMRYVKGYSVHRMVLETGYSRRTVQRYLKTGLQYFREMYRAGGG